MADYKDEVELPPGTPEVPEPETDLYNHRRVDQGSLARASSGLTLADLARMSTPLAVVPLADIDKSVKYKDEIDLGAEGLQISDADQLRYIFDAVRATGVDNAARIAAVADETGLPPNIVKHRIGDWEKVIEKSKFDPDRFMVDYPVLANLLLNKPQKAPVIVQNRTFFQKVEDKLKKFGYIFAPPLHGLLGKELVEALKDATEVPEDVSAAWEQSKLQARLEQIALKMYNYDMGTKGASPPTADEMAEAKEIEQELGFVQAVRPKLGFLAGMPGGATEQLKRQIDGLRTIGYYAGTGGAGGMAVGAAAGGLLTSPVGGVGALPGALGGAIYGFTTGVTAGIYATTAPAEAAMFHWEARKNGADPHDSAITATAVGVANGLLEIIPLEKVLRLRGGISSVLKQPIKDLANHWITHPSVAGALTRTGFRLGEGMVLEGLTEGGQEITGMLGEAAVTPDKMTLSDIWLDFVYGATGGAFGKGVGEGGESRIGSAAYKGAQAAGGMTLASPFATVEAIGDIRDARAAKQRVQFWEGFASDMSDAKVAQEYPPLMAEMIKDARKKYGTAKEVSVPARSVIDFFQAEGLSPEEIAKILPDVARQLDSTDLDAEVTIKSEDFITHFVPRPGFKTLVPDIRVGKSPTAREAPKVESEAKKVLEEVAAYEQAKEQAKTAGGETALPRDLAVYEAVRNALLGIDETPEAASSGAALWQAFARARASRKGTDPLEEFKKWNVTFAKSDDVKMGLKDRKGILTLYQKDDPRLSPHQRELREIAENGATPEERSKALDELVESFMRDTLTGADPQGAWLRFAPKDAFGNYVNPPPGWYVAIDVNDLKRINDTIGHAAGDILISSLAQAIGPPARANRGKFFRTGGDEFMLHFMTKEQADAAVKAIRGTVSAMPFLFDGAHKASISVGLAMDPSKADAVQFKAKDQARANGRSGFGREGAVDTVNLAAGDVFYAEDLSLNQQQIEILNQDDTQAGEVVFGAVKADQLSDADTPSAWRLPDGRVVITGGAHADLTGLPEDIKSQINFDQFTNEDEQGKLVRGFAMKSGRFWAAAKLERLFQEAWHGSPYTFDAFTLKHLSSGEGAQAFGWGLYFAQNPRVAKTYKRQKDPELVVKYKGKVLAPSDQRSNSVENVALSHVAYELAHAATPDDVATAIGEALDRVREARMREEAAKIQFKLDFARQGTDEFFNESDAQAYLSYDKRIERGKQIEAAINALDPDDFATGPSFYTEDRIALDGVRGIDLKDADQQNALDAVEGTLFDMLQREAKKDPKAPQYVTAEFAAPRLAQAIEKTKAMFKRAAEQARKDAAELQSDIDGFIEIAGGKEPTGASAAHRIASRRRALKNRLSVVATEEAALAALEAMDPSKITYEKANAPVPRLYKTDVPEDDVLLDYDANMVDQSPKVLEMLADAGLINKRFLDSVELRKERAILQAQWQDEYHKLQMIQGDAETVGVNVGARIWTPEEEAQVQLVSKLDSQIDDLTQEIEKIEDPTTRENGPIAILPDDNGWTFYQRLARIEGDKAGLDDYARNRGEKEASLRLLAAGIPGLRFLDGASRGQGTGTHNFVIWDETAIKIIDSWKQLQNSTLRGTFETTNSRDFFKITLTGKANLSTFLHESGHAFMAILEKDAMGGDQSALDDLSAIHNWLNPLDPATAQAQYKLGSFLSYRNEENRTVGGTVVGHSEKGITVQDAGGAKHLVPLEKIAPQKLKKLTKAQYEEFARGFEAYLREGKAPSTRLVELFQTFKAWLRHIYTTITKLNVTLDDDIRGVMDRLLATDIEIKEAKQKLGLAPLEDPSGLMPDPEYKQYRQAFATAVQAAQEAADRAALREFQRATSDEKRQLERHVETISRENVIFNAKELILNSKRLSGTIPETALMLAGRKLDRAALDGLPLDKAAKGRLMQFTEEGGLDAEFAAKALNMGSGKDLIMGLASVPSRETWIRQETERRMGEKYPGYKNNRTWMAENAQRALHTREVGNAIWAGYVALTKKLGGQPGQTARLAIERAAARRVGEMTVLEMKPHLSVKQEAKAAKEAAEAWKAGDVPRAYDATRRQLFHHEMSRQMDEARQEVKKITDYFDSFKDFDKRRKIAKSRPEFLAAIEAVLSKIEYGETLESGAELADLIKNFRDEGLPVAIPKDFNFDTISRDYEAMTLADLFMVRDMVQNLEHIASAETKELIKGQKMEFQALTSALAGTIRNNLDKLLPEPAPEGGLVRVNPTAWDRLKAAAASAVWHLKKIEFMTRVLDAGQTAGFVHQNLFQPLADSEAYEHTLMRDVFTKLRTEFKRLPLMDRLRHDKSVEFLGTRIAQRDVLMIAGNLRNEGNTARLVKDRGWTQAEMIKRVDELLTDEDLATINGIGRIMESLWPLVKEVYTRFYGIPPNEVTGENIVLPSGRVLEGGYFPVLRDPNRGSSGYDPLAKDLWDDGYVANMVGHGFTEKRAKNPDTKIWLNLDALPGHLVKVIHFITHFESTHKVNRLLLDPAVSKSISDTLGPASVEEAKAWIKGVVSGGDTGTEVVNGFDRFLRHTRVGATMVILGARISTAVIQGMGLTMSAKELSMENGRAHIFSVKAGKYLTLGAWQVLHDMGRWLTGQGLSPFKEIEAVNDHWILHRENYERDLRLEYKRLTSALADVGYARKRIAEFSMALFNLVQGTVNAITWHAALRKAQEENHPRPADFANSVLRLSQSAGGPKDLAGIQRGGEWKKWATVLYSFANVVFGSITEQSPKHLSTIQKIENRAAQLWWVVLAPAIITVMLKGGSDDMDDAESFAKAVALEAGLFAARSVPLVGDAARAATGREPRQAPWLDMLYKGAVSLGKGIDPDRDLSEQDYLNMINTVGMGAHLPTQAGINLVKYTDQFPGMEDRLLNLIFRTPGEFDRRND